MHAETHISSTMTHSNIRNNNILLALANTLYMCTCVMKDDSGEDYLASQTFTEEMPNTQVGTDTMKRSNSYADSLLVTNTQFRQTSNVVTTSNHKR